eukprot:CAMPEP_0197181648 /NCGR_PEP_ID=MMETSP1423-20130617/5873_1 /TAXON_ID=476441 /ORGANISM="Pseudo-nitzschia heimii, Strain UNC1101" /LENGTH=253 /DNA_ID=CAMNT_0042631939 /DNA_START=82 /DNA_END=840 /DNA_ORIENTATION=+
MHHVFAIVSLLAVSIVYVGAWTSTNGLTQIKTKSPGSGSRKSFTRLALFQRGLQRRDFLITTTILFPPTVSFASYIDPATDLPKITKRVYMDVEFGSRNEERGRLVIGLFGDLMPRTVENFETLCSSNAYAGTTFYRVISDLSIQGGAVADSTGKTGRSSFAGGKPFEPDNYNVKHTKAGLVNMVRGIGGSVDSRFFINTKDEAGWADDRYAAFGIIEEGMNLVNAIEKVPVSPPKNAPKKEVKIVASGVLND